jgi:hypothetical protein
MDADPLMDVPGMVAAVLKAQNRTDTPTEINSLDDAIMYWRSKRGGSCPAGPGLWAEMQADSTFQGEFGKEGAVVTAIATKAQSLVASGQVCQNAPGSYRGLRCLTMGSYRCNIEYSFMPVEGSNQVEIRFYGSDPWNFDWMPGVQNLWHNITAETIPSWFAGDGKSFDVTFDFKMVVDIVVCGSSEQPVKTDAPSFGSMSLMDARRNRRQQRQQGKS